MKLLGAAAMLAIFVFSCSLASASIVTITFTGIVIDGGASISGLDVNGLFGPAGSSLVGDAYTAIYTFDTSLGGSIFDQNTTKNITIYGGGPFPSKISPSLGATMTINGHTVSMAGDPASEGGMLLCTYPACGGASSAYNEVYAIAGNMQNQLYAAYAGQLLPIQTLNFDVDSTTPYQSRGFFPDDSLALLPLSAHVSTPLPATLPLFATGLGALGLLGWRRKWSAAR
jgi:hypothetical protein